MKKKNTKKLIYKFAVSIIIILIIIGINVAIARYKSSLSGNSSSAIAIMANDVYVDISKNISGYPGSDTICPIVITNKDDKGICEVAQKFEISIERQNEENIPINFSIYKDAQCTQEITKNENDVYTDENFKMDAGTEQTKRIYLKITWPENANDDYLSYEIESFRLHIAATQIN